MKKFSVKKVVTVLVAFSLCFTMVPFAAFAQEGPVTEEAAMAMENETLQIEEVNEEAVEIEAVNEEVEIEIAENEVNEEIAIEEPAAEEAEAEAVSEPEEIEAAPAAEDSESMVMQTVSSEDVTVTGLLPEGTEVDVESVDPSIELGENEKILVSYDITLMNDADEIQPEEDVFVTISDPSIEEAIEEGRELKMYHIKDSGETEDIDLVSADGDTAGFNASHFSVYIVVEEAIDAVTVLDGQTFYMTVNGWYLKPGTDEKMRTAEPGSGGITWTFKAAGTGDEEYMIRQGDNYLTSNGSRWTIVKDENQAGIFCVENEGGRYNIREKDTENYIGAGNAGSAKPNYFSVFRAKGEGTDFILMKQMNKTIDLNGNEYVIYTKAADGNYYAIMVDDMEGNPTMRAAKKVNVVRSNGQDYIYTDGEEDEPTVWTFEYAAGAFKYNLSTVKDGAKKYLFAPKANNTQLVLDNEGRGFNVVPRSDGSFRLVGSSYTLQGPNCPEYTNGGFKAGNTVGNETEWFRFAKLVKEEQAKVIEEPVVEEPVVEEPKVEEPKVEEADLEDIEETIVPEAKPEEIEIPGTVEEVKEEAAEIKEAEVKEEVAEVVEAEVKEEVAEVKEAEDKEEVAEAAKASEEIIVNTVAETIENDAQLVAEVAEDAQVEANIDNNDADAQVIVNAAAEKNETVANAESMEIAEAAMPLAVFETMSAAAPAGEIEMIDNGAVPMADAAAEAEADADYGWLVILAAALAAAGILFAVVARRRNREER